MEKYFCKECGKEISIGSGKFGLGYCRTCSNERRSEFSNILTKEILDELYINQKLSSSEIAKKLNIQVHLIPRYLHKHNIQIRDKTECHTGIKCKTIHSDILTKDYLYQKYVIEKMKVKEIAKLHNTSHSIICKYLKEHGIERRMAGGITTGKKHWKWCNGNYKGGYSTEFKKKRGSILLRDNEKCTACGLSNEEHKLAFGRALEVHHIDFNKGNDNETNLITLCKVCHLRLKLDMDYWFAYFKYLINEMYNEKGE